MHLTPFHKGLITGGVLIAFYLVAYRYIPAGSPWHYLSYGLYAGGIVWAILASPVTGFGNRFQQGFRCFMITTLMTAAFTFVFNKLHPEFADDSAEAYRKELQQNPGDQTPTEIEEAISRYKKGYVLASVYGQIFGYLIVGVAVSAATAALTSNRQPT